MANTPKASAVERALLVLETLDSSRRGLNISELSQRLHFPKSSTHVIVLTLERLGYVQKQPESLHYRLGLKAYALGHSMTKSLSISELALPHLRALVDQVRLSAHLAVHDGDQGVYIQKVEAPGLIRIDTYVGRRMDLHCTGVGKILLAFGPPELLERLQAKEVYIRYTKKTLTTPKALQREIIRVRKSGFALDDEEEELAVRCVAIPVFRNERFVAALSVAGTTTQIPFNEVKALAQRLRQAAAGFFSGPFGPSESTGPEGSIDGRVRRRPV
jgi:IclR family KDG regulon transcriptional repressor